MTLAVPDDLSDLERWAITDGFMSVDEVYARRRQDPPPLDGRADAVGRTDHGRDIVAALRDRGLFVRLGDDGRPRVGPRELVDKADLLILAEHRFEVLAALHAERGDNR